MRNSELMGQAILVTRRIGFALGWLASHSILIIILIFPQQTIILYQEHPFILLIFEMVGSLTRFFDY